MSTSTGTTEGSENLPEFRCLLIAVVEENPINRKIVEIMLTRDGHTVVCFERTSLLLSAMWGGATHDLLIVSLLISTILHPYWLRNV